MASSSRFAVAVHVMTVLTLRREDPTSSDLLAKSVGTNAAVIRRILSMLGKAGLVRCRLGAGGGALLAREAGDITLAEVYRAVESGELICTHRCAPSADCVVGAGILPVLEPIRQRAEDAMFAELSRVTLEGVSGDVLAYVKSLRKADDGVDDRGASDEHRAIRTG